MTKSIIFTIQNSFPYDQLKKPLQFSDDPHGISNWVMRFPLTIYSFDRLQKHQFTEGSVQITKNNDEIRDDRWNYFVITKNDGSHLYCTSQLFYQKGYLVTQQKSFPNSCGDWTHQHQVFYLPKCLVLISDEPYFKMHVNLIKIYRQIQKQRPNLTHTTNPGVIQRYCNMKLQNREQQFYIQQGAENGKRPTNSSIYNFYINQCKEHQFGQSIIIEKSSNLPVLHLYKLKSSKLFQFSHFFHLNISGKHLANVLTAILLEKQVIVTSKNSNLIVMVIQSLLQLIKPLKWQQMLVHNLPSQLIEVANQSFMPFLVGINKKDIQNVNISDKYVLFFEEDRFNIPSKLPSIGTVLDEFANNLSVPNQASYSNERIVLENSINFMCQLLNPIVKANKKNLSRLGSFYQEFSSTSICEEFMAKMKSGELKEFQNLMYFSPEERKIEIEKELNKINYSFQNPKIKYNETEWIQYYLSSMNPSSKLSPDSQQIKISSLQQLQKSVIKEVQQQKMVRKMPMMKRRSITRCDSRSKVQRNGQKIKMSIVKHEPGMFLDLLEGQLGIDPKMI